MEPLSSDIAAYIFDDSSAVAAPISEMLRAADAAQRLGRRETAEELIQMIFAALDEDSGQSSLPIQSMGSVLESEKK